MVDKYGENTLVNIMHRLDSACDILERLKRSGYTNHFVLHKRTLMCLQSGNEYRSIDLDVEEIFWLDGGVTQNGISIFALRSREDGLRGIFVAV